MNAHAQRESVRGDTPPLESDIAALVVFEGILSDGEREKLREMREIAKTRIDVRINSMREARDILDRAKDALDKAIGEKGYASRAYDEAILQLADDEDDDWDTAQKKTFKFDKIEADYLAADAVIAAARKIWQTAMLRVQWELREAERLGYMGNDK